MNKQLLKAMGLIDPPSRQYGWTFDKDHLAEEFGDEPDLQYGPSDLTDELLGELEIGNGHRFRLYDDDGTLCYSGRLVTNPEHDDWRDLEADVLFAPLDDYGMPGAGCTEVKYKDNYGHWESL